MAAEDFGMTPAFCSHGVNEGREEDHCVSNLLLKQGGFASHERLAPLMPSLAHADYRPSYMARVLTGQALLDHLLGPKAKADTFKTFYAAKRLNIILRYGIIITSKMIKRSLMAQDEEARKQARREASRRYQANHKEYYREKRKQFMLANPEKAKEYDRRHREKHKVSITEWRKEYIREMRRDFRLKMVEALGGKCASCGLSDVRTLQIDHIDGGGNEERKQYYSLKYYRNIVTSAEQEEKKYQLLCGNCHLIKHYRKDE